MSRSVRSHVRGALIAFALVGHGVYALPLPNRVSPTELEGAGASEIELWQGVLASVGFDVTRRDLSDWVVDVTTATSAVHRQMKAPFRPMFDLVGANQAWGLFASTTTRPERLVVEIQPANRREWETVLRRMDPCCTWMEDPIRYRRIRGVWDSQFDGVRPAYVGLTRWLAARAFEDFPEAERVRVRIERGHSTFPWEPVDPKVTFVHERVHRRGDLVPGGSSAPR